MGRPRYLNTHGIVVCGVTGGGLCRAAPGVAAKPRAQLLRFVDLGTSKSGSVVPDYSRQISPKKHMSRCRGLGADPSRSVAHPTAQGRVGSRCARCVVSRRRACA